MGWIPTWFTLRLCEQMPSRHRPLMLEHSQLFPLHSRVLRVHPAPIHLCSLRSSRVPDPRGILCAQLRQQRGEGGRGPLHALPAQQQRLGQEGRGHDYQTIDECGAPPLYTCSPISPLKHAFLLLLQVCLQADRLPCARTVICFSDTYCLNRPNVFLRFVFFFF